MLLTAAPKVTRDRVSSTVNGPTGKATSSADIDVHTISDDKPEQELPPPVPKSTGSAAASAAEQPQSTGSAAGNATKQPSGPSLLGQLLAGNLLLATQANATGCPSEAANVPPGKKNVSQPLCKFVIGRNSPTRPPRQSTSPGNRKRTSPGQLLRNSPSQRHRTAPSQKQQTSPHRRNLFKVPESPASGGRGGNGGSSGTGNRVKGGGGGKTQNTVVGKKAAALDVRIVTHGRTQAKTSAAAKTTVTECRVSRSQSPRPGSFIGDGDNRERGGVLDSGAEPRNEFRDSAAADDNGASILASQIESCRSLFPEESSLFDDSETSVPETGVGQFRDDDGDSRDSFENENRQWSDRESEQSSDSSQSTKRTWNDTDTRELIKRYGERADEYTNNTTPKQRIWKDIAKFVPPHTAKGCDSKWKYLLAQYTKVRASRGDTETGQAPPKDFAYFDDMDEILRTEPQHDPVMKCDGSWPATRNIPSSYQATSTDEEDLDDVLPSDRDSESESATGSSTKSTGNRRTSRRQAPLNTVEINAARAADRARRVLHMDRKEEFFKSTIDRLDKSNLMLEKIFEKL